MHTTPAPDDDFAALGVPAPLVRRLDHEGVRSPFPVQAAVIPDALGGADVIGRAPTGSGKTIAFGVPVLARVPKADPRRPTALVLAPTRELAQQIRDALLPLAMEMNRWIGAVYGGVDFRRQTDDLRKGVDVLVACPGRLLDLVDQGEVFLDDVRIAVVDEADRMADMGFLPDVCRILDQTAGDRQTLLFSATLDGAVAELTERYQRSPVRHQIGPATPDVHAMRHVFWEVRQQDRVEHAAAAIRAAGPSIVFCRTRRGVDRLADRLSRAGVRAAAIHGGLSQAERTRALDEFARGRVQALVATDVAARGIHVDDVACVVHYDPPADGGTYLHRSGRTARAGATGVVVSLVRPDDRQPVVAIQRELGLDSALVDPDPTALQPVGHTTVESRGRTGVQQRGERSAGSDPDGSNRSSRSKSKPKPKPKSKPEAERSPSKTHRKGGGAKAAARQAARERAEKRQRAAKGTGKRKARGKRDGPGRR